MKKLILTMVLTGFFAATTLTSCKPATKEEAVLEEKVRDAQEDLEQAKDSLALARKAATAQEWQAFQKNTDSVIAYNDARIAELKLKMKRTGKSIDVQYKENIDALEQKNKDLKVKMKTYKNDANADWQSFKRELNHDMTEIGQAFQDLTVDNKK